MFVLSFKFGYIVTGKYNHGECFIQGSSVYHTESELCNVADIRGVGKPSLENLWSLEVIGIKDPLTPDSDNEVLHKFCESIRFNKGRYYIAWPWKQENICLPDNYTLAVKRMKSLVNRFQVDPKLLQSYSLVLHHQLEKRMIDTSTLTNTRKYYLPYHPVLTPLKTTEKVRIVYDGSAKTKSASSS